MSCTVYLPLDDECFTRGWGDLRVRDMLRAEAPNGTRPMQKIHAKKKKSLLVCVTAKAIEHAGLKRRMIKTGTLEL